MVFTFRIFRIFLNYIHSISNKKSLIVTLLKNIHYILLFSSNILVIFLSESFIDIERAPKTNVHQFILRAP